VEPFVFVVGCERSGTTLLRAMLDSHPRLAVPPESHFLIPLLAVPFDRESFLETLAEHRRFARWSLPIEDVAAALDAAEVDTMRDAVRALYRTYASRHGKDRWGDKTPGYVRHLTGLAALLPESRFVHIIRDGRDVALSWMDTDFGPSTVTEAAQRWRKDVRAGRQAGRELPDRYLEVRYEDLVDHPEAVLTTICEFTDLAFDPAMLDYPERADAVIEATLAPRHHGRLRQRPTAGLRKWREEMPPDAVRAFEQTAGGLLARLGYPLAG
jgi:hypothetical protein